MVSRRWPRGVATSMSPQVRGRRGPSGGACRHTATPPSTRIVSPFRVAAATRRFDSATGSPIGPWPGMLRLRLTGREEEVDIAAVVREVHDRPAEDVGRVVAAGVEAHLLADLLRTPRFMDVAVQSDHQLILLDRIADSLAADRDDARPAAADHRLERLVELGREVEPGAVGRAVEVDDHAPARGNLVEHLRQSAPQLLLAELALRVPGGGGDVPAAGQQDRPELAELSLRALDARRRLEHRVDRERVVVSRGDDEPHIWSQPLLRKPAPALDLFDDRLAEGFVQVVSVGAHALDRDGVGDDRVETEPVDL